jgi:hypothetical protein
VAHGVHRHVAHGVHRLWPAEAEQARRAQERLPWAAGCRMGGFAWAGNARPVGNSDRLPSSRGLWATADRMHVHRSPAGRHSRRRCIRTACVPIMAIRVPISPIRVPMMAISVPIIPIRVPIMAIRVHAARAPIDRWPAATERRGPACARAAWAWSCRTRGSAL